MKKLLFLSWIIFPVLLFSQETNLSRITVGLGFGANHSFKETYDYYLSTDGNYNLLREKLQRDNMVLSTVIVFRFSELKRFDGNNSIVKRSTVTPSVAAFAAGAAAPATAPFHSKLCMLLSLNLLDTEKGNLSFNKQIDGGIGLGYIINSSLTIGILYEIQRYRQMRSVVFDTYQNSPIPNGSGTVYNALDTNNNDLFYYKSIDGISIKLIFNLDTLSK